MSKDVRYESRGMVATSVGRRLRKLRKAARMTQSQLGIALGVKPQQISKYERGADSLGLENLGKAARLFKITTDELLGHEAGFGESEETPFESMPHPPREAVERFVAALEDLLRQARDLTDKPRASRKQEPLS